MARLAFLLALIAALALALPAGAAAAKIRKGPAGLAFYDPPQRLPGKRHGDVIWARKGTGTNSLPGAARSLLVLYRSTSLNNENVAVSGSISFPKRKPPRGGWPIVTWAHGTAGMADICAPTRQRLGSDEYTRTTRAMYSSWLKAGYAVARTDYEGLGTPGLHPFLIGRSEARSLLDIVRAARAIDARVGKRVLAAGHSQGGQAALFVPVEAPRWTRELKVAGTFAYAPPSQYRDQINLASAVKDPSPLSAYFLMAARGIEVTARNVPIAQVLSDKAKSFYPDTDTKCVDGLYKTDSAAGMAPSELFREDADLKPVADYADTLDPGKLSIRGRVAISQGTADNLVLKIFTDTLVNQYRGRRTRIEYLEHENATHSGVLIDNPREPLAFFRKALR